jgi:hypothetical protein
MDKTQFRSIIEKHILPMYTGAEMEEEPFPEHKFMKRHAFLLNQCSLIVRISEDADYQFRISRSQPFRQPDATFVERFVHMLREMEPMWSKSYFGDFITPTIRRLVAKKIAPQCDSFVTEVLAQFETWAEQTYEGRKISAAVGIDTKLVSVDGKVALLDVYGEAFGTVLASGLESFLVASSNGQVVEYKPMPTAPDASSPVLAPLRFSQLAEWSTEGKIGIGLNRHGEILIFQNKRLTFAKRRGSWHQLTHTAVITRMSLQNAFGKGICRAVYQSCLDVSFARTGGCIAMVRRTEIDRVNAAGVVNAADFIEGSTSLKSQCLRKLVKEPFHEMDRRLRQDLLAMDGATIVDFQGKLLAAGAIVKVEAGSDGGGRLAAAKALSQFGLAIKISSDGGITGYRPGPKKVFTIG